ncbi:MAG: hypothetical protein ABI688_00430 [Bacteroidota bacterium]
MKHRFTQRTLKFFLASGMIAGLLVTAPAMAAGKPFKKYSILKKGEDPGEDKPAKKNKTKSFTSLNNSSVKIYPDVIKRDMHVVAKDNDGKEIDFFVFNIEGTLMEHYKMKAKDHNKLSGLARGTYVYRVFSGDEETAAGNFEIR